MKIFTNEKRQFLAKSNSLHKVDFVWTRSPHTLKCEVKWICMVFQAKKELEW